ncbi:MAG: M28 family peptidase [Candidatus Latescibacterota bacterium]|nr:MAG: M28 family peptidase [Candidatus Latescibacterota bacterium]
MPTRRTWRHTGVRLSLLALALLLLGEPGAGASASPDSRWIVLFEAPSTHVLHELADNAAFDVRWVESDLVVAEVEQRDLLHPLWGGRVVARRRLDQQLALLHARNLEELRAHAGASKALSTLHAARVAAARAASGEVWILLASPGAWPAEVLGCHGGLVLPKHDVDPRSLIERAPPAALLPWLLAPSRAWTPGEQRLLQAVAPESLAATLDQLTKNTLALDADRHVFSADLGGLYNPRVEEKMQRFVQGIGPPDSLVKRQEFIKTRRCSGAIDTTSTYNVIARLPGSVPGTGTFVVCGHIDATGSNDADWVRARDECRTLSATPGAEDNATGVAALVEGLRCIADGVRRGDVDFAFDLEFVAFSGEEAEGIEGPLTGSEHYVQQRLAAGTKLLGAINLDMVGSDSLGNNLQVVYNPASRWMAEWLVDAASSMDPPIDLTFTPQLDETLASDHNSFWMVNSPALLWADAPVNVLREYASYHRPGDVGLDVSVAKMAEVTRTLLAALLRFNTRAHTEPEILLPAEGVEMFLEIQGAKISYDRRFSRVWPGSPLTALASIYGLGAAYGGPLHVEIWIENSSGRRTVFDCVDDDCYALGGAPRPFPTGGRLDLGVDPIPIQAQDGGTNRLLARVTYERAPGEEVVQTVVDTFVVAEQVGLPVLVRPNPVRDPSSAEIAVQLERPGEVRVEVYNLEGELVATQMQRVQPFFQAQSKIVTLPILASSSAAPQMTSGTYFVRVRWQGPGGQEEAVTSRLVVIR